MSPSPSRAALQIEVEIPTARVFLPLLTPARYQGAYGGRGSGKSHFMAGLCVEDCMTPGTRGLCVREVQRSLNESAKRLIEDKVDAFKVPGFRSLNDRTITPGGGSILYVGMRDHTAQAIMSLEGIDWVWVEQAETLSARSLQILRPTIRKPGSRLRFTWNPRRKSDPVDELLRGQNRPEDAIVVKANWSENPWFPAELEAERQYDLKHSPSYRHIWEGEYATVVEGAYYASQIAQAQQEQRVTPLTIDPILELRAYWDIGINDATAIWIVQFNGQRIHVLDYLEGQGQPLAYYVNELRTRGYTQALCVLPHDAAHRGFSDAKSYEQHLKEAAFRTRIVTNQGHGAAMQRVEAMRRTFPRFWFDPRTQPGLEALGAYHEKRDDTRNIGLGPEHDWSSHAADAAGLIAIDYAPPSPVIRRPVELGHRSEDASGWMAS